MTAAHPLFEIDPFQDEPLDAACLAGMSPEERALAEAALARVAGGTVQSAPHADVLRHLEELHPRG